VNRFKIPLIKLINPSLRHDTKIEEKSKGPYF
jgi:hypothetical protein